MKVRDRHPNERKKKNTKRWWEEHRETKIKKRDLRICIQKNIVIEIYREKYKLTQTHKYKNPKPNDVNIEIHTTK